MIKNSKIIAHNRQLELLMNNFLKKFPHAWIFTGIKGIGKHTTAMEFIKKVYNHTNSFEQNVFQINSDKNTALIEDIRTLINQINLTNANVNQKCFVVIDNLENLNFNSYNALLKTIEEPPNNTILILICHNTNFVPRTILSRCIKLNFSPLNKQELRDFCNLKKIDLEKFDLETCYNLIGGSIQRLLLLSSEKGRLFLNKINSFTETSTFKIGEFNNIYDLISHDFENYYSIIAGCILEKLKKKYLKYFNNKEVLKDILKFFVSMEILTKQNLNIDNKKELHYLLSEYVKINKYE